MGSPNQLLFIAGAPRSGTTLLSNLLDGHRRLNVFPVEHGTIENYYWNLSDIERYARDELINSRESGQQTFLANREFYDFNRRHLTDEYGKDFDALRVDFDQFRTAYLLSLQSRQASLENILSSLAYALTESSSYAQGNRETHEFSVFKQPFYTEVFASKVASDIPTSRFIHISRDPTSRYLSTRQRRIHQVKKRGQRTGHINRRPYVIGSAMVGMASAQLAYRNAEEIGKDRYRVLFFEDLVSEPQATVDELLRWIGVSDEEFTVEPTRLGAPVEAGSVFSHGTDVDSAAGSRMEGFSRITSRNEQVLFRAALNASSAQREMSRASLAVALMTPLPFSDFKNYACQLQELARIFRKAAWIDVNDLIEAAKHHPVAMSGAT